MDATISAMRCGAAILIAALALGVAGCGSDPPTAAPRARAADDAPPKERSRERKAPKPHVQRARCDADVQGCVAVTGRVIYVEAVDPDGDGDAHYVLAGGDITAPGLSVIDVERALRPRRLPRVGDQVSAAGPVYTGSFGQRQIQAVVVHQRRAPTAR
jgi:hypothetical protein